MRDDVRKMRAKASDQFNAPGRGGGKEELQEEERPKRPIKKRELNQPDKEFHTTCRGKGRKSGKARSKKRAGGSSHCQIQQRA